MHVLHVIDVARSTSFGVALITCSNCCDGELSNELFVDCNLARALSYCEVMCR